MNDISKIEKVLGKFLSHEQIVALTEEIAKGVAFLNNIIDKNEKNKARKEFVLATFRSIDEMIEKSSKLPASLRMFYSIVKTKTHSLIEPLIAKLVTENDFSDLDDIPDVVTGSTVQRAESREHQVGANQPQSGEQGGGRRRRRRHGRNRNSQYQQSEQKPEPKSVETFPETSPITRKPEQAPAPKPVSKPEHKPEPKSVETFPETSQDNKTSHETAPATHKPETKSEPKPKRRTPKTDAKKTAEEAKPAPEPESKPVETFPETSPHDEPAPKRRQTRRKTKQNAE